MIGYRKNLLFEVGRLTCSFPVFSGWRRDEWFDNGRKNKAIILGFYVSNYFIIFVVKKLYLVLNKLNILV